jgi:peptidoglycan/LPS O-acetylase OafA/YrhL
LHRPLVDKSTIMVKETAWLQGESLRPNNFDLLRLLAATQVIFFHAGKQLRIPWIVDSSSPLRLLAAFPGVPIFFVISGFLISLSYERNSSLPQYLRNRFLRIYPGLWFCLFLSIIFAIIFGGVNFWNRETLPWLLAQLSIGQFYNPQFLRNYGVGVLNGSLWTIPVEIQFYLLLPIIYRLFDPRRKWGNVALLITTVFSIAVNRFYYSIHGTDSLIIELFGVSVLPYLYMFLIGVLVQRNFGLLKRYIVGKAPLWLAIYVALILGLWVLGRPVDGVSMSPLVFMVLMMLVMSFAFSFRPLSDRLLRGNDLSYGVYIYHMAVVNALVHYGVYKNWLAFLAVFPFAYLLAYLSWTLVEKKALAHKRNSLRQTTAVTNALPS